MAVEVSNGVQATDLQPSLEKEMQPEVVTGGSIALTLQPKKTAKTVTPIPSLESSALKDIFGDEEEDKPKREAVCSLFAEMLAN